jgi:hypothetical protein
MAYRKNTSRSSKSGFRAGDYVPTWKQSQTDAVNLIFQAVMGKIGVSDQRSYFERLMLPILLCAVVGAVYGAVSNGLWGFVWGLIAGIVTPAAVVWLGIAFCYCAVILGVFFAAWTAIIFGIFWLVGQ